MSLFDGTKIEPARYSDNPEFEEWHSALKTNLFEINGHLGTFQQFIKGLETNYRNGKYTTKVVENINYRSIEIINVVSQLFKASNALVQKANAIHDSDLDKAQLISRDKLNRDLRFSIQEFQKYQIQFANVTKKINERAKVVLDEQQVQNEGKNDLLETDHEQQEQQTIIIEREPINNEEFAYQQNLIRERDEEISNIERGIIELNDVFQDLGSVVQQQGQLVDNIENNIYTVVTNTQQASNELLRARRHQKNTNKWCLYILVALIGFAIILLMVS
ncbi:SNAP receptor PEP12 Ecym_5502 [Eremothecium cymbalariae DBVPG|uniref:t-SNARE coiled-coil homology domain-containing protein n=1 Tax=Eremothecium cymbalariae (strain CBS 270.75 / DBVPG 7215 / KCTC 17166 / NRRL Y-17582) TaxID=931890 RepID=I6NDV3_ERECY|nr:hypothetical protein Ecym_5502 [Eremothecium cymbalariae DBVPG\